MSDRSSNMDDQDDYVIYSSSSQGESPVYDTRRRNEISFPSPRRRRSASPLGIPAQQDASTHQPGDTNGIIAALTNSSGQDVGLEETVAPTPDQLETPPSSSAIYVAVYETRRSVIPGMNLTREWLRHSAIIVQVDPSIDNFNSYHLQGTPGIALIYMRPRGWSDPRRTSASLLAMNLVGRIPRNRAGEVDEVLGQVHLRINSWWNCQDWAREGLERLEKARLITEDEVQDAIKKKQAAIRSAFTTDYPNRHGQLAE